MKGEEADRKEISVFFAGTTPMPLSQKWPRVVISLFLYLVFVSGALNAV